MCGIHTYIGSGAAQSYCKQFFVPGIHLSFTETAATLRRAAGHGCLAMKDATGAKAWKEGENGAPSVFHTFLGMTCEQPLNLGCAHRILAGKHFLLLQKCYNIIMYSAVLKL